MRKYICATKKFCTVEQHINAPFFKTVFDCETISDSILEISVVGFYRLFLNGKEITKGLFSPYIHNPDDVVYYDEYRVDDILKANNNVLCVLLGSGFANAKDNNIWSFESAPFRSAPKFYLTLTSAGREIVNTERDFKVCDSAITFEDLRGGERYDARLENSNAFAPSYDSSFRDVLQAEAPKGIYKKCEAQPVKTFDTIEAVQIIKSDTGYIYDFGVCAAGIYKLSLNGKSGQVIDMTFGEMVSCGKLDISAFIFNDPPSFVSRMGYVCNDKYICKDGYQEYSPSFTYHGYRYCLVEGITEEQATPELLKMVTVHSDIVPRASFCCDDETVNKIQEICLRAAESNIVHIVTDSTQREKNGWTSEGHVTAEYAIYTYDCTPTLKEWLYNIRLAQREDGCVPGIVPTGSWGYDWNGPQWDRVIVELPMILYRFTGDIQILKDSAESVKKYIGYLHSRLNENGMLSFGLCDWCEPGRMGDGDCSTPTEITDTLIAVDLLRKAKEIFNASGYCEEIKEADEFIDSLLSKFRKKYVNGCKVICETQTAQALAVNEGVFAPEEKSAAFDVLLDIIKRDDYHLHSGILGYREVFNLLAEQGKADVALTMMLQKTSPSYANIISQGATSVWEKFTEYYETPDGMRQKDGHHRNYSLNQSAFGGVSGWFYRYLAGIRIINADEIVISPRLECDVGNIRADFSNNGNSISVRIEKQKNNHVITVDNKGFCCTVEFAGQRTACSDNGVTTVTV